MLRRKRRAMDPRVRCRIKRARLTVGSRETWDAPAVLESHRARDEALRGTVSSKHEEIFCFELRVTKTVEFRPVHRDTLGPGASLLSTQLVIAVEHALGAKRT